MRNRLRLAAATGALAIVAYVTLAAASYASYPTAFSPLDNWLSDLGNTDLNPSGSLLYRLDAVVIGILLALFFIGIRFSALDQRNRGRVFITLAQVFGLVAAFALLMTGIFSEGTHASHSLWSNVLYVSFGMAVFFSGWAFLYFAHIPRGLSYLAFLVTAATWAMSALNKTFLLEWILVALMLLFVGAVSYRMMTLSSREGVRAG
jgi:Protein of unknown function (DUF998)